jgi:hypothetical protein
MVKRTKAIRGQRKSNKKKVSRSIISRSVNTPTLDSYGLAYAKLLADPCTAELVHPTYNSGTGGFLSRFESSVALFNGATDTAGVLHWYPGRVGISGGTAATNFYTANSASATTGVIPAAGALNWCAGAPFLTANAASCRCVAACLKVSYYGTELNRAGYVTLGNQLNDDVSTSISTEQISQTNTYRMRTPDDTVEFRWRPSDGDTAFSDPALNNGTGPNNDRITMTVAGLTAATGVRIDTIAVYEWTFSARTANQVNDQKNITKSRNTLSDVIGFLDYWGDWAIEGVKVFAPVFGQGLAVAKSIVDKRPRSSLLTAKAPLSIGW